MMYLSAAVRLTPGGSSTVHIYTQTVHRTTQLIWEECGPCPVFALILLVFKGFIDKNEISLNTNNFISHIV